MADEPEKQDDREFAESPAEAEAETVAPAERPPQPVFKFEKGTDTAQVWMSGFLIVIAGVIAYSGIWRVPFQVEDQRVLCDNTALHSLVTFPDTLAQAPGQPLSMLTLALTWRIAPNNPVPFHALNLILHLANGVLIFLLCRRLLGASVNPVIAMLAGMLFVLHPLCTESVNYAVGRSGILGTFFVLSSSLLFLRAVGNDSAEEPPSLNARALMFSVLCFILACGADHAALAIPPLLFVLDAVAHGKAAAASRYRVHALYWAVGIALVAAHMAATGPRITALTPAAFVPFLHQASFPASLNLCTTLAPHAYFPGLVLLAGVVPACVAVFLIFRKPAAFGLAWVVLAFIMTLFSNAAYSERLAYFPLVGVVLLLPWVFTLLRWPAVRAVAGIAVAVLLIAAGTATYSRNLLWQDPILLWSDTAQKSPESPAAALNLGKAYLAVGEALGQNPAAAEALKAAEASLRNATQLDPESAEAARFLGAALVREGRVDDALAALRTSLWLDSTSRDTALYLALLFNQKAEGGANHDALVEAIGYFQRAHAIAPLEGDPLAQYGMALATIGDFETAEPLLQCAVGGNDESPVATALKNVQETLKRIKTIEQQAATLLAKNPTDPTGLKMQAQALVLRGHSLQAAYVLDRLLRSGTQDFGEWLMMGCVRAKMQDPDGFLREWPMPPPAPAEVKSPWAELAAACAATGMWDAAQKYLESQVTMMQTDSAPLLTLADIAFQLRQGRRGVDYLRKATEAYPKNPVPWLRLCDVAIAGKDADAAGKYLAEAESRGADAAEVTKRKERLGQPVAPGPPVRTMIQ